MDTSAVQDCFNEKMLPVLWPMHAVLQLTVATRLQWAEADLLLGSGFGTSLLSLLGCFLQLALLLLQLLLVVLHLQMQQRIYQSDGRWFQLHLLNTYQ